MKKDKFLRIRISPAYVSFLRNYDSKVMINSKETVEKIYSFTSNKSLFEDIVNKIDSNTNYKPDKMDNEHLYHYVGEVENDLIR